MWRPLELYALAEISAPIYLSIIFGFFLTSSSDPDSVTNQWFVSVEPHQTSKNFTGATKYMKTWGVTFDYYKEFESCPYQLTFDMAYRYLRKYKKEEYIIRHRDTDLEWR